MRVSVNNSSRISSLKPPCTSRFTPRRTPPGGTRAALHDPGSIPYLIETTLGFGRVTRYEQQGGSGWASFFICETSSGNKLFVKTSARDASMFDGEAAGLTALGHSGHLVIPAVHFSGSTPEGCADGNSVIIMDFLNFGARGDDGELGKRLAQTHLSTPCSENARNGRFGFELNNTCGDIPQVNDWCDDWVDFFVENRLRRQLRLAGDTLLSGLGEAVIEKIHLWFTPFDASNPIKPSVLHGDLWSGNIGTVAGQPAVFDPAVYYGHNEAEFGMEWCAGFSGNFYDSYFSVFPKTEKYFAQRRQLYRLYHYLNHYNLFGGGYKNTCVTIMKGLIDGE